MRHGLIYVEAAFRRQPAQSTRDALTHTEKGRRMKNTVKLICAAIFVLPGLAFAADAPPAVPDTLGEAILAGKPLTNFRLRYEYVDQAGKADEANAWTLRSLIGWQTQPFKNFSFTAQLINVAQLNDDFYDGTDSVFGRSVATPADKARFPTVADPDYTGVNQLFLEWTGLPDTKVRVGRQSVKLDNVRFIGNVEFRQVMQVFDGVALENRSIPDTELYFAHFEAVRHINTIYRSGGNVDIAHASWKYAPTGSLTGYGYFQNMPLNNQNPYSNDAHTTFGGTGFSDNSNRTLGLRADGSHKLNDAWKLLYTAEYAKQDDYRGGNRNIDAHYWRLGAGAGWNSWYLRLDRELLSSNGASASANRYAFQTPLGTNHLFQGWADLFLTTPKEGIEDTYLSFGGKLFEIQLSGEYHWFDSDRNYRTTGDPAAFSGYSGSRYGKELDLAAAYAYDKHWSGKLEYFRFQEDECYAGSVSTCLDTNANRKRDTDKFLFTLMYAF